MDFVYSVEDDGYDDPSNTGGYYCANDVGDYSQGDEEWILDHLCQQYKIGFDSLKELMSVLAEKPLFPPGTSDYQEHWEHVCKEVACIDHNLNQLFNDYGKHEVSSTTMANNGPYYYYCDEGDANQYASMSWLDGCSSNSSSWFVQNENLLPQQSQPTPTAFADENPYLWSENLEIPELTGTGIPEQSTTITTTGSTAQWELVDNSFSDLNHHIDYQQLDDENLIDSACCFIINDDLGVGGVDGYTMQPLFPNPTMLEPCDSIKQSMDSQPNQSFDPMMVEQVKGQSLNGEMETKKKPATTKKQKSTKSKNGAKKKRKSNETRIWYKCGWNGCSFGSFYNGVVKRHGHKRHSGNIKIDKSSNSTMHRFKCDWPGCDVSLVAYHKLVEHKRKHTGEKPFRCKYQTCNYATARLYSMIIHERTHKLDSFL